MSDAFVSILAELRRIMLEAAPGMVVTDDTPTSFTLKTAWTEARTKQPAWFGSIAVKKSYVAYHVMPLYVLPALNDAVPASLATRRQGKTCFNFKKADAALFEDIRALTELAARMEPDLRAAIGQ
jgi:hypothetical protein